MLTLPKNITKTTPQLITQLIEKAALLDKKTIRKYQDIVDQQIRIAYNKKQSKGLNRLNLMRDIYTSTVLIKEFPIEDGYLNKISEHLFFTYVKVGVN